MKSVFVSSTFRDMNYERDILNHDISPRLNHRLSEYNQSIRILDLRWGVDTSDLSEKDASERVLSVCFDAIEDCKPYFIILLGDRYGYIPENNEYSVTHLEILRGAIENTDRNNVFIYFRNADYSGMPEEIKNVYKEQNADAKIKLESLKQQLQLLMPDRCRQYNAKWSGELQCLHSEDFEELIYNDLESVFIDTLSSVSYSSPLHKQIAVNENILNDNTKYAYRNEELLASQIEAAEQSKLPYGIIGDGGIGKSVFLSLLCSTLRTKGHQADILFCGNNAFSASSRNAAEFTLYLLTKAAGENYDFTVFAEYDYQSLLKQIIIQRDKVQKKCYLLLDATDKCDDNMLDYLLWCKRFLSNRITIVFSSRMTQQIENNKSTFCLSFLKYDKNDLRIMAEKILKKFGKSINSNIAEMVCNKASSALHLELLLLKILTIDTDDFKAIQKNGGDMNAINAYLEKIINESPDYISQLIINYMESLLDICNDPTAVCLWLCFIAFSFNGLSDKDLQDLTVLTDKKWIMLDYTDFLSKFSFFIRTGESGRTDISHDIIREALRKKFDAAKITICTYLAEHFSSENNIKYADVDSFLDAAYESDSKRLLLDFIEKHDNAIFSDKGIINSDSLRVRSSFFRLLRKDQGAFLLSCFEECNNEEELFALQYMISSSLSANEVVLKEEEAQAIAGAVMVHPLNLPVFPDTLTEISLRFCEDFLSKNHVNEEEIKIFLEFCYQVIHQRRIEEGLVPETESERIDSADAFIEFLKNSDDNNHNLFFAFNDLLEKYHILANHPESAATAEDQLLKLLQVIQNNQLKSDELYKSVTLARLYSYLAAACKLQKKWEKALLYDRDSLEIYRKLHEQNPDNTFFQKYRERVYNIANLLEAWAIEENNNFSLWEKAKEAFEEVYSIEILATAELQSEEHLMHSVSAILSYGTTLLMTKNYKAGLDKYSEGINIATEFTEKTLNHNLQFSVYKDLLNCVYITLQHNLFDVADEIASKICLCIDNILKCNDAPVKAALLQLLLEFSGGIKTLMTDKEFILHSFSLLSRLYISVLPIANDDIKMNLIFAYCIMGDIYLLEKKDYINAIKAYQSLLNLSQKNNLLVFTENENYTDIAIQKIIEAYINTFFSLKKLNKDDTIKELTDHTPLFAERIAACAASEKINGLQLLFLIGVSLREIDLPLGTRLLTKSFQEIQNPKYKDEKYHDTIKMIADFMMDLLGGNIQ